MIPSDPVLVARDDALVTLTLNAPERRNALSVAMRRALADALEEIEADRSVRVVILTGTGEHFCSGGDLAGMEVGSLAEGRERMRQTHRLVRLMVQARVPIIAAVEGWCAGAGISLACASDHVIAGEGARFVASFGKVGLLPDLGLLHTLPLRVGQGRARELLLFGETVDASRALAIGLVDRVVPAADALAAARQRAALLAAQAPLTLALTKAALAAGLEAALAREQDIQAALYLTPDHAEGKAAFLEKRPPRFSEGT
ncbi:enoyl-CoA hydratase/isomerase family protein [Elioraea tepida]|uniref:Enoyl-CoA hydratase/isomerase family protein n=1 Tax=Elioraea tepida TaxID=2843330 RepID=A0A975U1E0_9PROT|nr:enoyl-CoA hydratase/isomerase family protein [Elioraea tepida]QXM23391.1 enoyl-CoA hydratase/isomerase family protein [Elioraea tepida]